MADRNYISGLYFSKKYPKSPDFVLGRGSVHPEKLSIWLEANKGKIDDKGYINFQILQNKVETNKGHFIVDEWKPEKKEINTDEQQRKHEERLAKETQSSMEIEALRGEPINPDDIPF